MRYIMPIYRPTLFAEHGVTGHLYANDIQAFVHGSPINQYAMVSSVDALARDLHSWMSSNRELRHN